MQDSFKKKIIYTKVICKIKKKKSSSSFYLHELKKNNYLTMHVTFFSTPDICPCIQEDLFL